MKLISPKKRSHDCPFLERSIKCTNKQHHKDVGGKHRDVYCGYNRCKNCPYYNNSNSKLKDDSGSLKTPEDSNE